MKRSIDNMVKELRLYWKHYVFQSLIATVVIFIVLLYLSLRHAVVIASIGATSFIVFAMPSNITAQPRNVIGGHTVGLMSGFLCTLIPHSSYIQMAAVYSLAVGITMFIMVVTDTEHPPAAGTALDVVIVGFSLNVAIAVIASATILSLVHHFFKRYLRDLT